MFAPTQRAPFRTGARLVADAGRALSSLFAGPAPRPIRLVGALGVRSEPAVVGEREVSVLFADLRGYSRYAECHRPAEIFRLLEAYAERASAIVHGRAGRVLSFHGDGLLAVFDARNKERAALDAARDLCRAVGELGEVPCRPAAEDLPIGIGIATGMAFLGRIGSGVGATWSAAGDATNVAARLQELSRTFRSPIVMDRETFARVATPCAPHPRVAIRGRETTVDVFTPLVAPWRIRRGAPAPVGAERGAGASLREAPAGVR